MGYKLRLSVLEIDGKSNLAGKHEEKLIHPSRNRTTLSELKPNTKYSVTLLASNEFGDGVPSSPIIAGKSKSRVKSKTQACRLVKRRLVGW